MSQHQNLGRSLSDVMSSEDNSAEKTQVKYVSYTSSEIIEQDNQVSISIDYITSARWIVLYCNDNYVSLLEMATDKSTFNNPVKGVQSKLNSIIIKDSDELNRLKPFAKLNSVLNGADVAKFIELSITEGIALVQSSGTNYISFVLMNSES